MTNLLWTINFTQNRLRLIFRITAVVCILIVTGDLLMIPYFNGIGAALVYLSATIVEYVLYLNKSVLKSMKSAWLPLVTCIVIALISALTAEFLQIQVVYKVIIAAGTYSFLLLITRIVRRSDVKLISSYFHEYEW